MGRKHGDVHVADAEDVADLQDRPIGLLAVHGNPVGGSRVADDQPSRARLDDGMAARGLGIVQDEVAGGVAADDGDVPGGLHLVHRAARVADRELHRDDRWKRRKTARL